MLFCSHGATEKSAIDELAVFVSQASANRLPAYVQQDMMAEDVDRYGILDLSRHLTQARPSADDTLVLIAAEKLTDARLRSIRQLTAGREPPRCIAFGRFQTRQDELSVTAKLAYALGSEPCVRNLYSDDQATGPGIPVFGAGAHQRKRATARKRVALFFPDLSEAGMATRLRMLAARPEFDFLLITDGAEKAKWQDQQGFDLPCWHLREIPPAAFARQIDIAVFHKGPMHWYRYQSIVANLATQHALLVDATTDGSWQSAADSFISGPHDPAFLSDWLKTAVLPVETQLRQELAAATFTLSAKLPDELAAHRFPEIASLENASDRTANGKIVFMPTNGVGLGHAKRCSLIAGALKTPRQAAFAAFPSCTPMLNQRGFDTMPLIGRKDHVKGADNDFLNNTRIGAFSRNAGAFVFDGGYVFDSVFRTVTEQNLPSVWIRRGLWQASQNNNIALDRSKIFDRIIVPTEAFDELNDPTPRSDTVFPVGPVTEIVQPSTAQKEDLRAALRVQTGREFDQLVVTMLGGGVAADRCAQVSLLSAHLATRPDVLHLVVVWPTARTHPAWFTHPNTRVVHTVHATKLIAHADLFVSAVGYNSFHEALYAGTPTIFVPQMAAYMDDQRARARAAESRGLALLAEPWEPLKLIQDLESCLDGQANDLRKNIAACNLPETGNRHAARLIEELCA